MPITPTASAQPRSRRVIFTGARFIIFRMGNSSRTEMVVRICARMTGPLAGTLSDEMHVWRKKIRP